MAGTGSATAGTILQINAAKLRRERVRRALTQKALATTAGLDDSTISYLETGARNASLRTIRALAEALGVDPLTIAELDEGAEP